MQPKYIILTVAVLFLRLISFAQNGYSTVSIAAGYSTQNSKFLTLAMQKANNKKLQGGFMFETLFYSDNAKTHNLKTDSAGKYYGAGYFITGTIKKSRNFYSTLSVGGALSTNFSHLIYYPTVGLSESFYLLPKTQLFFAQKVQYLFQYQFEGLSQKWQPSLHIGFSFLL